MSEWKDIHSLLSRIKERIAPHLLLKKALQESLQNVLGVNVSEKDITIRGATAFISAHPTVKVELTLKQALLHAHIKEKGIESILELR